VDSLYPAAVIAADLADKSTAKRLMRELENKNYIDCVAEIAVKIGDTETIARIMQEMVNKGLNYVTSYTTYVGT